jgi:hypothetical protein
MSSPLFTVVVLREQLMPIVAFSEKFAGLECNSIFHKN